MMKLASILALGLLWLTLSAADAQLVAYPRAETIAFHAGWDATMRDPAHSPLKPEERAHFRGISWFPIQAAYRVTARFTPSPSARTFLMRTSSGKPDVYVRCGVLTFTLNHHLCRLAVYQSAALARTHPDDSLLVPFTDKTSGMQSYGGGRYLDFPKPKANIIILDFNRAYNPYCAYTDGYSCPIPPSENRLPVAVLAGAKVYRH